MAMPTDWPPGISVLPSATSTSIFFTGTMPSSRKIRFAVPLSSPARISMLPSFSVSVAFVLPESSCALPGSAISSTALEPAVSDSLSGSAPSACTPGEASAKPIDAAIASAHAILAGFQFNSFISKSSPIYSRYNADRIIHSLRGKMRPCFQFSGMLGMAGAARSKAPTNHLMLPFFSIRRMILTAFPSE